jgi:hypothetical protein
MVFSALIGIEMIRQVFGSNLGIGKLKMGFLGEKCQEPESYQTLARLASTLLATASSSKVELAIASRLARLASCSVAVCPVSRSCVCFICFCFKLVLGINMKVVDNCDTFPVAMV